jgi:hypothetical protein
MSDNEFNPGILIGGAFAAIGVFAALAALYLWAVQRAKARLDPSLDPPSRLVLPWLSPLLLLLLSMYCLGIAAVLWKAYENRSWPEGPKLMLMSFAAFMLFVFWRKLRKKV